MTPKKVSSLEKSIAFVIQFRLIFISLMGLLIGLSGVYTLKNLSIDNSLGIWFLEEDPSTKPILSTKKPMARMRFSWSCCPYLMH